MQRVVPYQNFRIGCHGCGSERGGLPLKNSQGSVLRDSYGGTAFWLNPTASAAPSCWSIDRAESAECTQALGKEIS